MESDSEIAQCSLCGKNIIRNEAYRLKIGSTFAIMYICKPCIKENTDLLDVVDTPEKS
jgi:hypothetical protein